MLKIHAGDVCKYSFPALLLRSISLYEKTILTLAAAAWFLGTPAAQAAFVPHPVEVVAAAPAAPAPAAIQPASLEVGATVSTKVVTAKKKSFFSKIKSLLAASGKSQVVALLLVLFLGGLGIHRFYLGYTWQGIVQLLTLGGLGIWSTIDLIRIIIGDLQPKDGAYDKTF